MIPTVSRAAFRRSSAETFTGAGKFRHEHPSFLQMSTTAFHESDGAPHTPA